ncbi:MAG: aldo/keto reductase [Nanobdellota archaeon]
MTSNSSRVCIGTWKLFEKNNLQEGTNVINYALENGFNSFDTAHVYSHGLPEKILGSLGADIWIANKLSAKSKNVVGLTVQEAYPVNYVCSFLLDLISNSSNLNLLQIHNWLPSWGEMEYYYLDNIIKSLPEFEDISLGVSLSSDKQYSVDSISPFKYVQLPLNIKDRRNLRLINDSADSKKFIVRNIFDGGNLDFRRGNVSEKDSLDAFRFVYSNDNVYKLIIGCNSIESIDLINKYERSLK